MYVVNWYGDEAKAQMFIYDEPYNLLGCLVWIDRKGTSGNLQFKVYKAMDLELLIQKMMYYALNCF